MQRKLDLQPTFDQPFDIDITGFTDYEVQFHLHLLADDDYIVTQDVSTASQTKLRVLRTTNQGADFLDSIRDTRTWKTIKQKLASFGGSAALETVKRIAVEVSTSSI